MIFKTGLFLHMFGLFLLAGGSVGSVITESLFWKNIRSGSGKAPGMAPLLLRFPPILVRGAMLMLLSGLIMLYSVNWIFWGQTWFTIKLLLFVLLVLNGRLNGKPVFIKIAGEAQSAAPQIDKLLVLRRKINRFHIMQFIMLFILIALVIFKV